MNKGVPLTKGRSVFVSTELNARRARAASKPNFGKKTALPPKFAHAFVL